MPRTIDEFMTRTVHTIGSRSPLSEAHRLMNEHAIRHLPVLEGGKLVGVVSMRDLHLVETLKGVDPKEVTVEEAMSQDAYTVHPGAALIEVARTMAMHKYGSAVVASNGRVEGIFTTVDALKALDAVLSEKSAPRKPARSGTRKAAPAKKKSVRAATKRPTRKAAPARKGTPARKRGGR